MILCVGAKIVVWETTSGRARMMVFPIAIKRDRKQKKRCLSHTVTGFRINLFFSLPIVLCSQVDIRTNSNYIDWNQSFCAPAKVEWDHESMFFTLSRVCA